MMLEPELDAPAGCLVRKIALQKMLEFVKIKKIVSMEINLQKLKTIIHWLIAF